MAVGAQQVEGRPGDPRAGELPVVGGIVGYRVDAQQVAEPGASSAGAGWPITSRLKRVSSSLSNRSSTGPSGLQLEPQPRESDRPRAARPPAGRPASATAGSPDSGCRSARWCGTRACCTRSTVIANAAIRARICVRNSPANQLSDTISVNARSVVRSSRCATGMRSALVGVEQRRRRRALRRRARASTPGCRRPAGRCSCPARPSGCGCAPRRRAGSSAGRGSARRSGDGCDRSRTSCTP